MTPCGEELLALLRRQGGDKRARSLAAKLSVLGFTTDETAAAKAELDVRERRTLLGSFWSLPPQPKKPKPKADPIRCGCGFTTTQRHPVTGQRMCLACQVKEGIL